MNEFLQFKKVEQLQRPQEAIQRFKKMGDSRCFGLLNHHQNLH